MMTMMMMMMIIDDDDVGLHNDHDHKIMSIKLTTHLSVFLVIRQKK